MALSACVIARGEPGMKNTDFNIKFIFLIEILVIGAVLVAVFGSGLVTQYEERFILRQHANTEALEKTLSAISDAEAGQRGFILTGFEVFLEPYNQAKSQIGTLLSELDQLASVKRLPPERVQEIRNLVTAKIKFMEDSITIRRQQGFKKALEHSKTKAGKLLMDNLREQVGAQAAEENAESDFIRQKVGKIIQVRNGIFVFCTTMTVFFMWWAYRRLWKEIQRRDFAIAEEMEQKELVSVTLASIGDGVIVTDEKGVVTFLNGEAQVLTGWSLEAAKNQPLASIFNIVNEETRQRVENPVSKVLRSGTVIGLANHTILISKNGSAIPIDDSGAPIRIGNEVRGVVLVFRDITSRKEIETQLIRAKEEAERASHAKTNFLANMSHELRTPLTAITGFSELLLSPNLSEDEKRQFTMTIRRNGKLLTQIIDDILDLSKVEAEKLVIENISCSLSAIIEEVMSLLGMQAREKGLSINVITEGKVPDKIKSDPVRLKQILINMIGNAIKFTSAGGIEVRLSAVRLPSADTQICILVEDTGRGIAPEHQVRLFQPFMQADESTTRKFGGTGLGLVLSKRLAQALGGDVILESSKLGIGSTFKITFKTSYVEGNYQSIATLSEMNEESWSPSDKNQLKGVKVLVADDAPDNQMLIRRYLTSNGAQVDVAENGKVAVKKALGGSHEILLMDLLMPVQDGFMATSELRRQGFKKPILAVSAAVAGSDRERALEAGCNEFLTKPIDMELLVCKIRQFLHLS